MRRPSPAWRALVAFHAGAGARAALRAGTVGAAGLLFAVGSSPNPLGIVRAFVHDLVGRPDPARPGGPGLRVATAALAVALAALGGRRVTLGGAGWMRSLPVDGRTPRRAAWAAAAYATTPLAAAVAGALVASPWFDHAPVDPARVAGAVLLFGAAAALALPVHGRGAPAAAALSLAGAVWGRWPAVAAGVLALAAWDRAAGGLAYTPGPHAHRATSTTARRAYAGTNPTLARVWALWLPLRWAWRVTGWRAALGALLAAALPTAFAALARRNNPELAPATADAVVRAGLGIGLSLATASGAEHLLARRPPWPWARTLPWSAAERVGVDAAALALPALLAAAAATFAVGLRHLAPAAAVVLVAAAAGASALRVGARRQTGAAGETLLIGSGWAVAVALVPTLTWAAPVAAVALAALGSRRDRHSPDAVRWNELRHDTAGDVGWISRQ